MRAKKTDACNSLVNTNRIKQDLQSRCTKFLGVVLLLALVSCNGDPNTEFKNSSPSASNNPQEQPVGASAVPNVPIAADAHQRGMWSSLQPWPLIAAHSVLTPDGRVLTYGTDGRGNQTAFFIYDVWDPKQGLEGGHMTLPNGTRVDMFCGSQVVLPTSGEIVMAGGDNWDGQRTLNTGNNQSTMFDFRGNALSKQKDMNLPRWYATSTTLLNGETYIQGGLGGRSRPEVRGNDGVFRLLDGADTSRFDYWYPRNWLAPDGVRIFGFESNGRMYYVDPRGAGSVERLDVVPDETESDLATAAMFRPGRILQVGGVTNRALVIDIRGGGAPVITRTQSMARVRAQATSTILPNGQVVVNGGSEVENQLIGISNEAETWNPETGQWTVGAAGSVARMYHSTALLLPDATVLVAGGGAPGPLRNLNAQIYYPSYLFKEGGQLAPRLQITQAPQAIDIGRSFALNVDNPAAVTRVTMIKTGAVTHGFDMAQRFIELTFTRNGNELSVQAPPRAADAPPGFYLVFVLDAQGVPSVASIVKVNIPPAADPTQSPTLDAVGNQTNNINMMIGLQLVARDPNGDALTYSASGLPPGLTLDPATGRISGVPTTPGSYNVSVAVSDGTFADGTEFVWAINNGPGIVVGAIPNAPALPGSSVNFTATATGINPQYQWNFGDGTPVTDWSANPSTSHNYTQPGTYYVTVTARDERGLLQTRTFLQRVRLGAPGSGARTAASSLLAYEPRVGANARLWVVNQDNDSVAVIDAVTRTRVAEIAVGAAPRSIARSRDGLIWVTNRDSASLSVINPNTLQVVRTVNLPRASQPYGLVLAPAGANHGFVALSAIGQVMRFDTTTFGLTGVVAVGPQPRELSLARDGATLYVSRFITPPLPGESTAQVVTQLPGQAIGAEVLELDAATLAIRRTIVLAHSDRPDEENQGRGVPNYLGAVAVSPDASQAFVPSKQDNVLRGALRDGTGLNFRNTVRAVSSRIDLATGTEDLATRIDHDNAAVASAAVFDPSGVFLFVALETSNQVAVIDAHARVERFRFDVGRAPQALAISSDGNTLYVGNTMDRSVGLFDLRQLLVNGQPTVPAQAVVRSIGTEKLAPQVLRGKQLFYDARDPRLARDGYLSCASCHRDGGQDGRVWDMTGLGEGLRNTVGLRGRAGGQGSLHWSAGFDEVQDFENQIRQLAGGTGLMSATQFSEGTRDQPLGDRKAGISEDLDALAAYVRSLDQFDESPHRTQDGSLSQLATQGQQLFSDLNCASCHSGSAFTGSGVNTPINIGTIRTSSGGRLGQPLLGIDVPTLRDVWGSAPYLHDGSALRLEDAVRAHRGLNISDVDANAMAAYLREIGREEQTALERPGFGTGLRAEYYNNNGFNGAPALMQIEGINTLWTAAPGPGVSAANFSVRWTGLLEAPLAGSYVFQTQTNNPVRMWIDGVLVINNFTAHGSTANNSRVVNLMAGQWARVVIEYVAASSGAEARLRWQTPGDAGFKALPLTRMYAY